MMYSDAGLHAPNNAIRWGGFLRLVLMGRRGVSYFPGKLFVECSVKHLMFLGAGDKPSVLSLLQAALCCIRILRHLPEHVEDFMDRIKDVLNKERNHGVLVATVQLVTSVVESNPQVS